ncbi:hypothetical protein GCM10027085_19650 [Spirosoma aerophilum]
MSISVAFPQSTKEIASDCVSLYEAGLSVGRGQYFGDFYGSPVYLSKGANWGAYGFIRRRISSIVALRGNLMVGQLSADDLDEPNKRWDSRRLKFTTPVVELAALTEIYPLAKKGGKRLSPYVFAGAGVTYTSPKVTKGRDASLPPSDSILALDSAQTRKINLVFPVGVGLSYAATPALKVGLEVGYRFSTSDYLDGFQEAGYKFSKHRDSYLTASVVVAYQLGAPDYDHDHVPNNCDACPHLYGLAALRGCPDADNDGVIDPEDGCPDEFGDPATCGCPDDDQDGVPNSCDCCPNEKGDRAYHGCPKAHNVEYEHARVPARMRYCPLCPPDLLNARRTLKTNLSNLIHKSR